MGYTHGRKWTDSSIEEEVKTVIKTLGINHFPTHSEIEMLYGCKALSVAISKHGGTNYWANKLNIPVKESETSIGNSFEIKAIADIKKFTGLDSEHTLPRYPYDILVDKSVKVDVKVSKLHHRTEFGWSASFNLEKKNQTCDVFVFYCLDADDDVYKTIIIPSTTLSGQSQIGISQQSKWNIYIDRWGIITEHADFFDKYKNKPKDLDKKKRLCEPKAGSHYV